MIAACTCASVSPGMSVRPPQSIRVASRGRSGSAPRLTRTMRSPSMMTVERDAGSAPVQSSRVQLWKTVRLVGVLGAGFARRIVRARRARKRRHEHVIFRGSDPAIFCFADPTEVW